MIEAHAWPNTEAFTEEDWRSLFDNTMTRSRRDALGFGGTMIGIDGDYSHDNPGKHTYRFDYSDPRLPQLVANAPQWVRDRVTIEVARDIGGAVSYPDVTEEDWRALLADALPVHRKLALGLNIMAIRVRFQLAYGLDYRFSVSVLQLLTQRNAPDWVRDAVYAELARAELETL
jgi:hypothetical protein